MRLDRVHGCINRSVGGNAIEIRYLIGSEAKRFQHWSIKLNQWTLTMYCDSLIEAEPATQHTVHKLGCQATLAPV
jgi:hypothetical protein|tara:strand:+ start:13758 stop:13982 length:225 start_codon:yes stop_codon:yes gene_type:complete